MNPVAAVVGYRTNSEALAALKAKIERVAVPVRGLVQRGYSGWQNSYSQTWPEMLGANRPGTLGETGHLPTLVVPPQGPGWGKVMGCQWPSESTHWWPTAERPPHIR